MIYLKSLGKLLTQLWLEHRSLYSQPEDFRRAEKNKENRTQEAGVLH